MRYVTIFSSSTEPIFFKCPMCKYRILFTPVSGLKRPYKTAVKCWHCRQAYISVTFVDSKE